MIEKMECFLAYDLSFCGSSALHFSGFGVVAGIALLYFTEGVPRVRRDILQVSCLMGLNRRRHE